MKNEDKDMPTSTFSMHNQDPLHADTKDGAARPAPLYPTREELTHSSRNAFTQADWRLP